MEASKWRWKQVTVVGLVVGDERASDMGSWSFWVRNINNLVSNPASRAAIESPSSATWTIHV